MEDESYSTITLYLNSYITEDLVMSVYVQAPRGLMNKMMNKIRSQSSVSLTACERVIVLYSHSSCYIVK